MSTHSAVTTFTKAIQSANHAPVSVFDTNSWAGTYRVKNVGDETIFLGHNGLDETNVESQSFPLMPGETTDIFLAESDTTGDLYVYGPVDEYKVGKASFLFMFQETS